MGFEADTPEKLQKHVHLMRLGQRSGLKVIDEQTHFFPGMGLHSKEMKHENGLYFLYLCV